MREIFDGWRRWEGGAEKPVGGQGERPRARLEAARESSAQLPSLQALSCLSAAGFLPTVLANGSTPACAK